MWVAREQNGALTLFHSKPYRGEDGWGYQESYIEGVYIEIDDPNAFPDLKWEDEPKEVIVDTKNDLIKRFEILNMMYQSTDPESINHMPFNEYALKHWDEVDMNYFDKIY